MPANRLRLSLFLLLVPALMLTGQAVTMRIGYFPNITHSQALIGLARGDFAAALGPSVKIDAKAFNAGPAEIEALFANQLDLAYIGPNPAINGFVKSNGEALRVVAGATSGGAAFVVRADSGINSVADLRGKVFSSPQLGNTQDVALRSYLIAQGHKTVDKGGSVSVQPMENSLILDALRQKRIDGAWVPEPWAARLQIEGGARLLVDERTLWKDGKFATALVIVSTRFLSGHPDLVQDWLKAHVAITQWAEAKPAEAKTLVNAEIKRLSGAAINKESLDLAWSRIDPTWDPLGATLQQSASAAYSAGFLKANPDLSRLVDLGPLNKALAELKLPTVAAPFAKP